MEKNRISANVDNAAFLTLKNLADRSFDGNINQTLNWILHSIKIDNFYRFMSKYYAGQLNHCQDVIQAYEEALEEKNKRPEWVIP